MQISDALIKSCISNNRNAQKQLYELLLPYLRAVARRYLRDQSYIKDVLQESFVKVFREINQYDFEKATIKQWAAKITINTCFNYNKRVIGIPKEELVLEMHQTIIKPTVEDWSREDLLHILKQMPEGYFEVFNLSVIDGYSHEEIAAMLNIKEALSRKRLSRARTWLKKTFIEKPNWLNQISPSSFYLN